LFRPIASCLLQQKLWPSERTTCDWQNKILSYSPSHGGFPSVLIATSLAISKQSTFLSLCKQQLVCSTFVSSPTWRKLENPSGSSKVHSKSAYSVAYRDVSLIRQRTSQPTPLNRKGILNLFQPLRKLSIPMLCLFIPHRSTQSY
jgi:hypothetical protein